MSRTYRVQYSDVARAALAAMNPGQRKRYHDGIADLAKDPYGLGSSPAAPRGSRDRRQVTLADTITIYWVSDSVLTISVVQIVH